MKNVSARADNTSNKDRNETPNPLNQTSRLLEV